LRQIDTGDPAIHLSGLDLQRERHVEDRSAHASGSDEKIRKVVHLTDKLPQLERLRALNMWQRPCF
jgi:hypothetical protein